MTGTQEPLVQISNIPFGTTDFTLRPGMSYQVADNAEPHRSYTEVGAKLFVVD